MFREPLAYNSFAQQLKHLRGCGVYQLDPESPKYKRKLHNLYVIFVLCMIVLYTVQQIMKVYQVLHDINKVMATMFLLLTNTDSLYKQLVCWKNADQIEELLEVTKGPIFNQQHLGHREIHIANIKKAKMSLYIFNIAAVCTCFLWSMYPVILYIQGNMIEFAIWLPFDANLSGSRFLLVTFYVWVQTTWLAFINTSLDIFICYLWGQCKTQLCILRYNLENLVKDSKAETKSFSSYIKVLDKKLKNVIVHYIAIKTFSKKIEEIFGSALLYLFAVACWIFCASVYRIIDLRPGSVDYISMIMYLSCILYEIYLYCFSGNDVVYQTEKLIESAYATDWLEMPVKQRRILITFMESVKRPIQPKVGILVILSNQTFISIVKTSYSLYAFLKNSEN